MIRLTWRSALAAHYRPFKQDKNLGRIYPRGASLLQQGGFHAFEVCVSFPLPRSPRCSPPFRARRKSTTGPKERYEMDVATDVGLCRDERRRQGGDRQRDGDDVRRRSSTARSPICSTCASASNQDASAPPPKGDHFFLPQAKLGKSVPLIAPERGEEADILRPSNGRRAACSSIGAAARRRGRASPSSSISRRSPPARCRRA